VHKSLQKQGRLQLPRVQRVCDCLFAYIRPNTTPFTKPEVHALSSEEDRATAVWKPSVYGKFSEVWAYDSFKYRDMRAEKRPADRNTSDPYQGRRNLKKTIIVASSNNSRSVYSTNRYGEAATADWRSAYYRM